MRSSTLRRIATPFVAGVAAVGLIVAGSGTAMAADPPPAWSGDKTADNLRWNLSLSAVNGAAVDRTQVGVNVVYPGDTVTYAAKIWKSSGIGRYITTIRQIAPAGFQYQSNTISKQSTVTNEGTAGVKATCSGGGCNSVPVLGNKGYLDNVDFAVTYKIPDTQAAGDYNAGFLFDVYSFGSGQGTNPAGAWVRVADPITTTTTVQAPASATTGHPVTLTAALDPSNANGQVQFKDGGTDIGSPVTPVGGVATLTHTFGAAGAHDITAQFTAGRGFHSSTSAVHTVTVTDPDVVTSLSLSAPTTAETSSSVDLTAAVSPANAQGSVQFKDNGTDIGAPVAVANGAAVLPHSFGSAGAHSITADFTGAAGFTNSTAAAHSVTVTDPDIETSVSLSAPASAETGSSVDLTATVSPSGAQGSVQFTDNGAPIGAPVQVINSVATLPHTFTSAGAHSIAADFTAAAGFTNSSATAQPVTVTDPDVETSLSVTVPGAAETGESVTLSAQVTPANAQGSVQFKVDGVAVGAPQTVSGGAASLPYTFDTAGSVAVTAEFTGAAGFTNATAAAQNVTVSVPDVVTSLTLGVPATAVTGTSVDLTANLSPSDAEGTVQFTDNGAPIGSPVQVVNGSATLPHTFTATGSRSIGASFTGGPGFTDTSAASLASIVVSDPDLQTTTMVSAPATAQTGGSVNLEATVSPAPSGGTVQFQVGGVDVGSPVTVSGGAASLPWTFNAAGTFAVTAVFSGSAGFEGSTSNSQSITVSVPDATTSLAVQAPATAVTGTSVDLTANVSPSEAQGSVQFKVGGVAVGSPVAVSGGTASLPHTFNAADTYAVTAEFTGAAGFTNSTASAQNVTVSDPDQQTSLTVQVPGTATTGASVNLVANLTPQNAQGSVQFKVGGVAVGSPVAVSGGAASLPHTFNAADTYAVTAEFTGAAGFTNSTASAQNVTVSDPAPVDVVTSTLVGVPGAATTGVETTLSATVQAQSGTAVPSGSVQFRDNGSPIGSPVALVNGSASLGHTFTVVGTHQVSAVYTADSGFVGSTSVGRPVVVSAPNPSDVVSSVVITSTQSPTAGTPFVLKAQVIGAATLPGTVQFFDGGVELGTPVPVVNGVAELTHTFTQSGLRQIHAVYSGGTGVAGSTSDVRTLDVVQSGGTGGTGSLDFGSLGSLSGLRFGS